MAKAENRVPGATPGAAGNVDLAERGSHSEYSRSITGKLDSGCLAFVRVADEGWLELTCPAPGERQSLTLERRRIRVDGPADCHLLRLLRDVQARR
jgi:hypothetical protein